MKEPLFEKFIIPLFIFSLLIFGVSLTDSKNTEDGVRIDFLDVGQGDATLVKTVNKNYILIDGGPDKKIIQRLGEEMPITNRKIKALILTHPHADHLAGLNYVLDSYIVEKVYLTGVVHPTPEYDEFIQKLKEKGIQAEKMYSPKEFEVDGVKLVTYWPKDDLAGRQIEDLNETSIVTTVNWGQGSALLMGDLPELKQNEIASSVPDVDILKVAHHGSKNGVSRKLLEKAKPEYAIISAGRNNEYGHPHQAALNLLSGQKILRTDLLGTIRFLFTQTTINPL